MNACILVKMACVDNYVAILIPKTVFNYLAKSRFIRCGYCPTIQELLLVPSNTSQNLQLAAVRLLHHCSGGKKDFDILSPSRLWLYPVYPNSQMPLYLLKFKRLVESEEDRERFRAKYRIPPTVDMRHVAQGEWVDARKEGEVVIPMIAFIEGGMTILIDKRSIKPRLDLVNRESLDRILRFEVFVNEADNQLRAAHVILGYTPISFAFQAPKCVIKANDPRLLRISVAYEGFIVPEGIPIPEGTPFTQPLFVGIPSVGASSSQPVPMEEEEEREREEEENPEGIVTLSDSSDEFELDDERNRSVVAVELFNIADHSNKDLRNKLTEEERARKSAESALEGAQKQAEDQRQLLHDAKEQLATSKEQIAALRKKLEEAQKLKDQIERLKDEQEQAKEPEAPKEIPSDKAAEVPQDRAASQGFEQALASVAMPAEEAPKEKEKVIPTEAAKQASKTLKDKLQIKLKQ
uniref:Uncharacterized protein n=1 Tax=Quercus lobata TaxID=97700 RepID=A0A7N2MV77_QUELO